MDRKGIIAVTLSLIGLFAWQAYYSRQMDAYNKAKQAEQAAAEAEAKKASEEAAKNAPPAPASATAPAAAADGAAAPASTTAPATPPVEEKLETLSSPSVQYSFTNLGGGISRATLLKHIADQGGLRTGDHETKIVLNQFGAIPIGAITERPGEDTRAAFTQTVDPSGTVTFERTDERHLRTTKRFAITKETTFRDEYLVALDVTFTNTGDKPIQLAGYYVYTGSTGPIHLADQARYLGFDWYDGSNRFKDVTSFVAGGFLGFGRTDVPTFVQPAATTWASVTNQYFCQMITPEQMKSTSVWAQRFQLSNDQIADLKGVGTAPKTIYGVDGALGMPGFTLEPNKSTSQRFQIYAGPREYGRLKLLGQDQDDIMNFGMLRWFSEVLLSSLNWLKAHLGSYAAAIIVLTLIVRGIMWPMQNRSTASMKKMQALTPKMNELKEKYKDDPQRMNEEVMKMYRDYGVNPIAGCLPMFLQLPIFWGLFGMLGKAVELRNSHFLWVKDLSQPDTVAFLLGYPLNILPLFMAGTMFLQMRLSPKTGDPAQQKVFAFMPLMFVMFCYNYASALALYFTVGNIFSIVQLYLTRDSGTPVLQKVSVLAKKKRRG